MASPEEIIHHRMSTKIDLSHWSGLHIILVVAPDGREYKVAGPDRTDAINEAKWLAMWLGISFDIREARKLWMTRLKEFL